MSTSAGDAGALISDGRQPAERKITIRGLPVYSDRLLSPDSQVFHSLRTIEEFARFAERLRGQFCILIQDGLRFIAITDFGCSRPVFYLRDSKTLQYHVSTRLADLVPFSRKQPRKESLFFYAVHGGVGLSSFYSDIEELHPATVTCFLEGRIESRTYLDWSDFLETRSIDPETAERRFIEIASGYLSALLKGSGQIGCLLSGGTDSALMAWLLREMGVDTVCFTADYTWKKYSEFSSAAATARAAGLPQVRVPIGAAGRREAFYALNGPNQNAPCCDGLAPIIHQMAGAASNHGISTLITGDHADSLFLGFERFFAAFPPASEAYSQATAALSSSDKLAHLYSRPSPARGSGDLLAVFGLGADECAEWRRKIYSEDCHRMSRWTDLAPLHILQQLSGQIWAGIPWQNLFLPVTQAFDDRIEFVSPFYDLEMIRFGLSLPLGYKFRNGSTKVMLRDMLVRKLGRTVVKRASPNPARIWRIIPDLKERALQGPLLRSTYDRAYFRNLVRRGMLWNEVDKVAALGIWLSGQPLDASWAPE